MECKHLSLVKLDRSCRDKGWMIGLQWVFEGSSGQDSILGDNWHELSKTQSPGLTSAMMLMKPSVLLLRGYAI